MMTVNRLWNLGGRLLGLGLFVLGAGAAFAEVPPASETVFRQTLEELRVAYHLLGPADRHAAKDIGEAYERITDAGITDGKPLADGPPAAAPSDPDRLHKVDTLLRRIDANLAVDAPGSDPALRGKVRKEVGEALRALEKGD